MKFLLDENFPLPLYRCFFEDIPADLRSQVIISRLPQGLPTAERVELSLKALNRFAERRPTERLFDLLPSGEIVAWEIRDLVRVPPQQG